MHIGELWKKRILPEHVGRKVRVRGHNRSANSIMDGVIEELCNGIATVRVDVIVEDDGRKQRCPDKDGYRFLVEEFSDQIVEVL